MMKWKSARNKNKNLYKNKKKIVPRNLQKS